MQNNKLTINQIDELKEMYYSGILMSEIYDYFNITPTTFYRFAAKNNIILNRNVYKLNKTEESKKIFNHKFSNEIIFNDNISKNDYNTNFAKYSLNEDYFDVIDNQDKSYILGLLLADGNMNQKMNTVTISLQERDLDILEKITLCIESNRPLRLINMKSRNINFSNQYKLSLYSRHLCNSLVFYKMIPNKSLVLEFPDNISIDLYKHFFRGYIDGDGNISKTTRDRKVRFVSTEQFCVDAKLFLENYLDINCSIKDCKTSNITKELCVSGGNQCKKLLNWIYDDANLFIKRKYDVYKKYYC